MTAVHQDFLDTDFRANRGRTGIPYSAEFNVRRHQVVLPPDSLRGKHVLDIGSFNGLTADWCLNSGVASYTGIDISAEFCDVARNLLSQHHAEKIWSIDQIGAEKYLSSATKKFDVIIAWGLHNYVYDNVWLMKQLARVGDKILLGGRHPGVLWQGILDGLSTEQLHQIEYNIPYQEWHHGDVMTFMYKKNTSIRCTGSNSSMAALSLTMELEGFRTNTNMYETLKKEFPNMYKFPMGLFVLEFTRDSDVIPHETYDQLHNDATIDEKKLVKWFD
jgi:SAM-dependent methyltransferase